jgi:N utilization substance protein A
MKNEFILAFNEICESRNLPKEDVFEALKKALVSAYRRDVNVGNLQKVAVEIDPRTGDPTIYAEKEVVDEIMDNRTEVTLDEVRRAGFADAQLGDLLMVDSTTAGFGRIAAQTAKQVLLQSVREAEREHLYEDFSGREGELVNGTVQSISGQHITIGLGRTEALLPKSHQVHGERYRAHDKIRVYVLEVRRTNRGPQIFVSRNHRNLLRRLLELEVPEIYNGQVEIKSIAREAGQRSKVAVQALQPGVDPVGACVGMRGVRIQSIVRELNDEKIDVIEWDPNQVAFIAKALSPARVSHVFLEDHPENGKTAVVIVPDDQLSLAIGREGQNARLAAKLTGWRIDIKSLTESAADSLNLLDEPEVDSSVAKNKELVQQVKMILEKKEARRPITSEDYYVLNRLVSGVEGRIIQSRAAEFEEMKKQRLAARRDVPTEAWEEPIDVLDLPGRVHNLLLDNEINTIGDVLYNLSLGDDIFLNFRGFGEKGLEALKEHLAQYQARLSEGTVIVEAEETIDAVEAESKAVVEVEAEVMEAAEEDVEDMETVELEPQPEPDPLAIIDDLSQPLIQPEPVKKEKKAQPAIVVARRPATDPYEEEEDSDQKGHKGKQLVFDEKVGQVVVKRKRKRNRRREDWDEFDEDDF